MATWLLVVIYLAFISLGLPDSLLGTAWPVMQTDLHAQLATAGGLFMTIAGATIVSSLMSGAVLRRFGTGKVAFVSTLMTAIALLGFSLAPSLLWLFVFALPLGLGAGSIDAGLNNYVATHYKAHHMSWLHCFWGVGATLGPVVMAPFIAGGGSAWRTGYVTIAALQGVLVIVLLMTLPLWSKAAASEAKAPGPAEEADVSAGSGEPQAKAAVEAVRSPLRIRGVKLALAAFLFYCGVEATVGLWGASFLVNIKELAAADAARWVSLYYAGITLGRFIAGFITLRVGNRALIRSGQLTVLVGVALLLLPLPAGFSLAALLLIGLGLAPIFPCMLHETPARFGREASSSIIGYQMALAYVGSTCIPPLLGLLASRATIGVFPAFILVSAVGLLASSERLNALLKR
ncbi:MFS transporter [Paenibacillus athensensis]|uniref:MFS transporter n=1 Tax=Paenibacillus athensensis TaxID=1967502 RepID=A0A4Y8Q8B3_9BACL|nr:MFS transporter [Paenibacillus athensensis]MCD1260326.1 MFS transporter [Paenibacillus athensensis]